MMQAVFLCAAVIATIPTHAETVYVIDHLAVGVHENKTLNSPIIKVLPTGTALEVLEREEAFVKVRTDDGLEGWVDKNYVMEDKPSQLALLELEAKHVDAVNELEVARAEIESLTLTVGSLESAGEFQETTEEATSDALREMHRLAEENQALKQELTSRQSPCRHGPEYSGGHRNSLYRNRSPHVLQGAPRSDQVALDYGSCPNGAGVRLRRLSGGLGFRRRHGGFRV